MEYAQLGTIFIIKISTSLIPKQANVAEIVIFRAFAEEPAHVSAITTCPMHIADSLSTVSLLDKVFLFAFGLHLLNKRL